MILMYIFPNIHVSLLVLSHEFLGSTTGKPSATSFIYMTTFSFFCNRKQEKLTAVLEWQGKSQEICLLIKFSFLSWSN